MKVSDKGLIEIASHEGIVKKPYLDSVGVWTIGIGHTASAGYPDPKKLNKSEELSMEEVMSIFRKDIEKFENRVNDAVRVPLKQHQFDALVSFDFNTGGIYRAKLTKALNEGDYDSAANRFMGWSKPPEIIPRREKEQELFRTGKYGTGKATVYDTNNAGRVVWSSGYPSDLTEILSGTTLPEGSKKPASEFTSGEEINSNSWIDILMKILRLIFGRK